MARTREKKITFSVRVTPEIKTLIEFLVEREDITFVVFVKRAIINYIEGDQKIDARILETRRSSPDYIKRDALITGYMALSQKAQLEEAAVKQGATFSQALFQAMVDYCALLITIDDSGIEVRENN